MTSPPWLRYLPALLRARIQHRAGLQRILANVGWLFFDKVLRMGVGLLVVVWMARYLGPGQFGLLNYATAFVALFGSIAGLGLNSIVVRDLLNHPEHAGDTLGAAFVLQIAGGLLAFTIAVLAISVVRPEGREIKLMVAVLGFGMVFKATDVVKYWFEAQIQSKYPLWVENGLFLTLSLVKVGMLLAAAPLMAFVWLVFAEGLMVAVGLLWLYAHRGGVLRKWRIRAGRVKALLHDGWPLILSGLAVMVYMRIDQIMLGQMMGDEAVGIYTAAVRISEVWYFIPVAIVASVFPSIVEARKKSIALYHQRLQKLYDFMVLASLAVAVPMTFLSSAVVGMLFGSAYAEAGTVLALHIWTGPFVSLGVASGTWYLSENLQRLAFGRTLAGAVVNVLANLILIPRFGVVGAAAATVFSQATAAYFFDALSFRTREVFLMKTKSIFGFHKF